ncbi:MAG TPA: hypothetical protein VK447_04520 [Myxococcaceae bacterium]|nr:hypothetical protein [Myxococcaceae bacterium]
MTAEGTRQSNVPAVASNLQRATDVERARALLRERYVGRLRTDPNVLQAKAHPHFQHLLNWGADELEHAAGCLRGLTPAEAEFEMEQVLREVREHIHSLTS